MPLKFLSASSNLYLVFLVLLTYVKAKRKLVCVSSLGLEFMLVCGTVAKNLC